MALIPFFTKSLPKYPNISSTNINFPNTPKDTASYHSIIITTGLITNTHTCHGIVIIVMLISDSFVVLVFL